MELMQHQVSATNQSRYCQPASWATNRLVSGFLADKQLPSTIHVRKGCSTHLAESPLGARLGLDRD